LEGASVGNGWLSVPSCTTTECGMCEAQFVRPNQGGVWAEYGPEPPLS
jgi:hypothetical protein